MEIKKLVDICRPKQWKTIPGKQLKDSGYPVYGANGIVGYWDTYNHDKDTILIGCRGTCGSISIAKDKSYVNGNAMCLDDLSNEVELKYLYYFLKGYDFTKVISGSTIPQITIEGLNKVNVIIPSKERQNEIIKILDKLEECLDIEKKKSVLLDELVKARFVELFGDVSDFVNITDIAHTYIGLVTTMTKHYCNNGTPLLFNSSIKSDKIVWDGTYLDMEFAEANKSRMHKTNDIVTVHTGDIGTSAVVGEEFNNSLGFATIVTRINDISRYYPRFVSSFLNYGSGKEQLKKYSRDVRNNLNLKDFNRLMVPNVSALEQKRYVDFLEQTDKSKSVCEEKIKKYTELYGKLMNEYFGG